PLSLKHSVAGQPISCLRKSTLTLMKRPKPHIHPNASSAAEILGQSRVPFTKSLLAPAADAGFFIISEARLVPSTSTVQIHSDFQSYQLTLKRLLRSKDYAGSHSSASLRLTQCRTLNISEKTTSQQTIIYDASISE